MEEQFVPYELAVKLKELGFDEPCLAYFSALPSDERKFMYVNAFRINQGIFLKNSDYGQTLTAPLWQQAFDWFRDKYVLHIATRKVVGNEGTPSETISWTVTGSPWDTLPTYPETRVVRLNTLIKELENTNKLTDDKNKVSTASS